MKDIIFTGTQEGGNLFLPEMLQLNYELIITGGKLNGTRYPTDFARTAKIANFNKDKQPTTE